MQGAHSVRAITALRRVLVLSSVDTSQAVAMSLGLMVPPRRFPPQQPLRSSQHSAFPCFSLRLFLGFTNQFFLVGPCSNSKEVGTFWSCRSGWWRRSMWTGFHRQNEDTKCGEPRIREAMKLCRNKKNMVMLLEENSLETNLNSTPYWRESPEACKKSVNLH